MGTSSSKLIAGVDYDCTCELSEEKSVKTIGNWVIEISPIDPGCVTANDRENRKYIRYSPDKDQFYFDLGLQFAWEIDREILLVMVIESAL